jgi:hypothetical protein
LYDALDLRDVLVDEVNQRIESGFDLGDLGDAVRRAVDQATGPADRALEELLARLEATPRRDGWPYLTIDDAESLAAASPGYLLVPLCRARRRWIGFTAHGSDAVSGACSASRSRDGLGPRCAAT